MSGSCWHCIGQSVTGFNSRTVTEVYAPIREIYGPVGAYLWSNNGAMAGAYAAIYDNPYDNRAKVTYVMSNMISEYDASALHA